MVILTKVSTHNGLSKSGEEVHMYTLVHGNDTKKVSETLHMTTAMAERRKAEVS